MLLTERGPPARGDQWRRPDGRHSRLFELFAPEPAARRHFAILAAMLNRGGIAARAFHGASAALLRFPAAAALGALPAVILLLARETGARVHLCRISSREGLEMVRRGKAEGLPLTCDIAIHHAHLSEMDIGFFDANCRVMPRGSS